MTDLWGAAVLAFWGAALWIGISRERVALLLAAVIALGFPIVFYAFAQQNSGFGLQGRYALALFSLVPIAAGEIIQRNHAAQGARARWVTCLACGGMALFQLVAWWVNAHHWAGGNLLLRPARWAPPGGWWPWGVTVILGTGASLAAAATSRSDMSRRLATRGGDVTGR